MPSPPLPGASQAACWPLRPRTWGPCPSRASSGGELQQAFPCAARQQPSSAQAVASTQWHTRGAPALAGLRPVGSDIMPSPPLHGTSRSACWLWRPLVGPGLSQALPGGDGFTPSPALPGTNRAARWQWPHALAHVGTWPKLGFYQRGAASCPPLRCLASAEQRAGRGAHTRGAPAQAGLRQAGDGFMPSPPLPCTSRAACWSWRLHAWGPLASPGGEQHYALPSAARQQPSYVMAGAPTHLYG